MESESNSPSYNILAPRPWTSFKETPPSPLLVLRKREVKSPAPQPPVSPTETEKNGSRRSRKKKAPSPPVRSSSLKSSGNDDSDKDEDAKVEMNIATPKITIDLDETDGRMTNDSYKNEVSIFVFPETNEKQDTADSTELILDVTKYLKLLGKYVKVVKLNLFTLYLSCSLSKRAR